MSDALDLAIGMALVFATTAAVSSGVLDFGRKLTRTRERHLFRSIARVLDETEAPGVNSYTVRLYRTRAIQTAVEPKQRIWLRGPAQPWWMRAPHDEAERLARWGPAWLPPMTFARAVEELHLDKPLALVGIDETKDVGGNVDPAVLREKLAAGFETLMQPLTEQYRQRTRVWLFILGLSLAAVVNVDSIRIAKDLYQNDEIRLELARIAANDPSAEARNIKDGDFAARLPLGWTGSGSFGWWSPVGWTMTAAAVSLGAPFWYAAISQLTRRTSRGDPLRSTSSTGQSA